MAELRDLERWTSELVAALGLDGPGPDGRGLDAPVLDSVDIAGVLDLARLAAHRVARPAAPLTTFLAGFALAKGATLAEVSNVVARLADTDAEGLADTDADGVAVTDAEGIVEADSGAEPR